MFLLLERAGALDPSNEVREPGVGAKGSIHGYTRRIAIVSERAWYARSSQTNASSPSPSPP
jgi:hypothetical protein